MFTCHDGWHVVDHAGDVTYVRVAVRLRDGYGTYVYRVGAVPDDEACGTIWCYPDKGVPWTCTACGKAISARVYDPFQAGVPSSVQEGPRRAVPLLRRS